MRLNRFVALATGLSRRAADELIKNGQVAVNGQKANLGYMLAFSDKVSLNGKILNDVIFTTIIFNKPVGYVTSREGQGSKTIYDLLPKEFHNLKPVGRLDKDSSGLLLLTNDGELANRLTHPRYVKQKIYEVTLDKNLNLANKAKIEKGVELEDGLSKLNLNGDGKSWIVKMSEGRNRQIRRTFAALGYKVTKLHRIEFGQYKLTDVKQGQYKLIY